MHKLTNTNYSTLKYLKSTVPQNTLHCSEIPPLLRLLKGIFHFYPLLPLSTPSHCCTLWTAPIPTWSSVTQFSSNTVRIPAVGLKGVEEGFPPAAPPDSSKGLQACAQDRTDPQIWSLTDQLSLVFRITPWFHFWKTSIHDPSKFTYGLKCDKRLDMDCSYEDYCMFLKSLLGFVHPSKTH